MDAGAYYPPAGPHSAESHRYEGADRREQDRRVERFGRRFGRGTRPDAAEFPGEILRGGIAVPGEREDLASLPDGDLRHDMGGRPEPVQANSAGVARLFEGPVPDQPCA